MKETQSRSRSGSMARCGPARTAKPAVATTSRSGSTRRALFVGADRATVGLGRKGLESLGFVVDAAESGIAALVTAREWLPDLIFMDRQLRDVAAREAIGWLRTNPALRSTPIIVLIMGGEDEVDMATIGPGTSLRKPVSPAVLGHTIRRLLK